MILYFQDTVTFFTRYAFVYYEVRGLGRLPQGLGTILIPVQNLSKRLYFGRDPLGRRSLLIHKPTAAFPIFILCSVSTRMPDGLDFEELPPDNLFSLDLGTLCSLGDVHGIFFSHLWRSSLTIQKAGCGLR